MTSYLYSSHYGITMAHRKCGNTSTHSNVWFQMEVSYILFTLVPFNVDVAEVPQWQIRAAESTAQD
jgi:hypothetical protein